MKFLDLFQIKMPLNAVASILHRISGIILILSIPFVTYILGKSLNSEFDFIKTQEFFMNLGIIQSIIVWAFAHHIIAGIRFLLIDIHIGILKNQSKISAAFVLILSLLVFFILLIKLIL